MGWQCQILIQFVKMNKFRDATKQEDECLNGMGMTKGVNTCKWTPCENVGYCVDAVDFDYFIEMTEWEKTEASKRRLPVELDYDDAAEKKQRLQSLWGTPQTPRPTKPPKTPRPTHWSPPKTPRPTKVQTVDPTRPPKTPRPTMLVTPRPTKPPKTPRPTKQITVDPTRTPKTPRPTNYVERT